MGRRSEPPRENPDVVGIFSLDPRALGFRVGRRGVERTIFIFITEREIQVLS